MYEFDMTNVTWNKTNNLKEEYVSIKYNQGIISGKKKVSGNKLDTVYNLRPKYFDDKLAGTPLQLNTSNGLYNVTPLLNVCNGLELRFVPINEKGDITRDRPRFSEIVDIVTKDIKGIAISHDNNGGIWVYVSSDMPKISETVLHVSKRVSIG